MDARAMAIVMGPNMFRSHTDDLTQQLEQTKVLVSSGSQFMTQNVEHAFISKNLEH